MAPKTQNLSNTLAHAGRGPKFPGRSVNLPIHQSSTMLFDTLSSFQEARETRYEHGTLYYGRYGNPATIELERMVAELEGAAGCVTVSSGLSAVSMALVSATKAGDHLLVADNVYEPTRSFCNSVLARFGVEVEYFDPMMGEGIATRFRPNTTTVMFEAPGSGTFEVPDIRAIAAHARQNNAVSIIDGTWATPVFCQPLSLGVDMVVHSGSKYIGGHADSMIGFIACNDATFADARRTAISFGEKAGAQDVFLSLRGLRTLGVRMRQAQDAGLTVARWMAQQPQIQKILHPAFEDCPGHIHWKRDFSGASGLFSVVTNPCSDRQLHAFIDTLSMFGVGVSWGGFESLVLPVTPNRTATSWTEQGRVIRFNIGLEDTDSLLTDLANALPCLD